MSEGLKLVAAAIVAGAASTLIATPDELFLPEEVSVVQFAKDHYRQYRELPQANTIFTETRIRLPAANESVAYYVDRLYERSEFNRIRDLYSQMREAMSSRQVETMRETIAQMGTAVRQSRRRGQEVVTLHEAGQLVLDRIENTRGLGGVSGITSGWPLLDAITAGYQPADLISIVGRPEVGKTWIMLKQAWAAYEAGHSVAIVTTEMSAEQMARRLTSIALGLDPTFLRMNQVSTYAERRLRRFYESVAGNDRLRVYSVGMNSTVTAVHAFVEETEPDITFVDGAYLLAPPAGVRATSRTERVAYSFDSLRSCALATNRPIVASTQLNRTSGKGGKDASLENIGFSDAVGTHSSLVLAVQFGPTANPKRSRLLTFLKGREGESGSVAVNFRFAPHDMSNFIPEAEAIASDGNDSEAAAPNRLDWMA